MSTGGILKKSLNPVPAKQHNSQFVYDPTDAWLALWRVENLRGSEVASICVWFAGEPKTTSDTGFYL